MKLSKIFLYSGMAIMGVTSVLSWQRSNATAQRQVAVAAAVQPAIVMPSNVVAAAPTPPQVAAPTTPTTLIPAAAPSPEFAAPQGDPSRPVAAPSFVPVDLNVQVIRACNGQPANANLRSAPSLAPEAILGVVPQGEAVKLTGGTTVGDGEFWYEVIALAPLRRSSNPAATNQSGVGQQGQIAWMSKCFVSSGN